jgi:DNA-binding transcriptional MerR regulator
MFKIGEFSRLSHVPIKTLRYYDEIGLFTAEQVDTDTGYRYYAIDQMPRLNRILALKDLGFSLEQIGRMLDDDLSAEQLRGMLHTKRAEIERRVDEEQARLGRVEARLKQIEAEGRMPRYEVIVKAVEPIRAVTVRDVIANYASVGSLIGEVYNAIGRYRLAADGPVITIYHDAEYRERDVDVEIAAPVSGGAIPGGQRVQLRTLPGFETVLSLVRRGPYEDFSPVYQALMARITDDDYTICGPNREIYLRGPGDGIATADYLTEFQLPVQKP